MAGEIIGASVLNLVEEKRLHLGIPIVIFVVELGRTASNISADKEWLDDSTVLVPVKKKNDNQSKLILLSDDKICESDMNDDLI